MLVQVEKEKESLRLELNKAKQQIKEADTAINSQRAEIEKLNHIINEVGPPTGLLAAACSCMSNHAVERRRVLSPTARCSCIDAPPLTLTPHPRP
jgi:hypothetical protein